MSASDIPLFEPPFPPQPAGARPENPLQFDSAYVFEPDGLPCARRCGTGRLPVWSPELEAGWPLLATQQSAPLFPLTWIGAVFPYWESQAWIAVLKIWLAALGTFLFARALGLSRAPALLAAVSFGFGIYFVAWLMHPHVNAYVVLPWLLLLAERLCRTGALREAAALAGLLGLAFLSGQPESGMIVALATAAWVAFRLLSARVSRREAVRTGGLALAAVLVGAAIGAVMLRPLCRGAEPVVHHVPLATAAAGQGRDQPGVPRVLGAARIGPVSAGAVELHGADALRGRAARRCSRWRGCSRRARAAHSSSSPASHVASIAVALDTGPVSAARRRPAGARPGRSAPRPHPGLVRDRDARGLRAPAAARRHRPRGVS